MISDCLLVTKSDYGRNLGADKGQKTQGIVVSLGGEIIINLNAFLQI